MTESYEQNWVSPPGDTVADLIDELEWTRKEAAQRMGITQKHLSKLINGKVELTADMALKLETTVGGSVSFWMNREQRYREGLLRLERIKEAKKDAGWLKELPHKEMAKFGWIEEYRDKGQQVLECLNFFSTATVDAWRAWATSCAPAFRESKTFQKKEGAVLAWLRQAEIEAAEIELQEFSKKDLENSISELRLLTLKEEVSFLKKAQNICADSGVAFVCVRPLKGCTISGATWWTAKKHPVIALSLRHKSNDHLWFSFFHEMGHILKHSRKERFLEIKNLDGLTEEKENEANEFARNILIPPKPYNEFVKNGSFDEISIRCFAETIQIAPGIVVGRLQHEKHIPYTYHNHLKVRYAWVD